METPADINVRCRLVGDFTDDAVEDPAKRAALEQLRQHGPQHENVKPAFFVSFLDEEGHENRP